MVYKELGEIQRSCKALFPYCLQLKKALNFQSFFKLIILV